MPWSRANPVVAARARPAAAPATPSGPRARFRVSPAESARAPWHLANPGEAVRAPRCPATAGVARVPSAAAPATQSDPPPWVAASPDEPAQVTAAAANPAEEFQVAPWSPANPDEAAGAPSAAAPATRSDPPPWLAANPGPAAQAPWHLANPREAVPAPWNPARPAEAVRGSVNPGGRAQAAWLPGGTPTPSRPTSHRASRGAGRRAASVPGVRAASATRFVPASSRASPGEGAWVPAAPAMRSDPRTSRPESPADASQAASRPALRVVPGGPSSSSPVRAAPTASYPAVAARPCRPASPPANLSSRAANPVGRAVGARWSGPRAVGSPVSRAGDAAEPRCLVRWSGPAVSPGGPAELRGPTAAQGRRPVAPLFRRRTGWAGRSVASCRTSPDAAAAAVVSSAGSGRPWAASCDARPAPRSEPVASRSRSTSPALAEAASRPVRVGARPAFAGARPCPVAGCGWSTSRTTSGVWACRPAGRRGPVDGARAGCTPRRGTGRSARVEVYRLGGASPASWTRPAAEAPRARASRRPAVAGWATASRARRAAWARWATPWRPPGAAGLRRSAESARPRRPGAARARRVPGVGRRSASSRWQMACRHG